MGMAVIATLTGFRAGLARRLAVAGLGAALMAGIAAFLIETEALDDALVDHAALNALRLSPDHIDKARLAEFLADNQGQWRDYFVLAEVYDRTKAPRAEAALPDYERVENGIDRAKHHFPPLGERWYRKVVVDARPYLQVMVPLSDATGQIGGWFEGVYRVSPESQAAITRSILMIVGLVVVAVLATAGVLYPLMLALQGRIVQAAQELLKANLDTLKVLGSAIAKRDSDTHTHNFRVTLYSIWLARALGLDRGQIQSLIKGAFLHDVGKIAVPDSILLKPGKLDQSEFEEMKTHVHHGLDIIGASSWLNDAAAIVGNHHEKVDGSGYPQGLSHEAIPLAARIFAVADVFDALTSQRPYKQPLGIDQTLSLLNDGRGKHFDDQLVSVACAVLPDYHAMISALSDNQIENLADQVIADAFGLAST